MAFAPLIAAGIAAVGAINQGNAAAGAAKYNQILAKGNASAAKYQAAEEERRFRVSVRKQIGTSRAQYGASGVGMEGSPLSVLEESAYNAELDAINIRNSGRLKALGFNAEANLQSYYGKSSQYSAGIGAASSLLKGGYDYYNYNSQRINNGQN